MNDEKTPSGQTRPLKLKAPAPLPATNPFSPQSQAEKVVPWVLELRMADGSGVVRVQVREMMIVGRGSGTGAPDIDLTEFNAQDAGVSRRHAVILARKKFLTLRDMSSTNGTFLNGLRLMPDQDMPLEHGDLVSFGSLDTRILFSVVPPNKLAHTSAADTGHLKPLYQGTGRHVLIVEENEEVASVYRMMLEQAGYRVTYVNDIVDAAAVFISNAPDAVVLDLVFSKNGNGEGDPVPGMKMLKALRQRADRMDLNTPLIVVSSLVSNRVRQVAKELGATLFLPKPVRVDELVLRVGVMIAESERENPRRNSAGS